MVSGTRVLRVFESMRVFLYFSPHWFASFYFSNLRSEISTVSFSKEVSSAIGKRFDFFSLLQFSAKESKFLVARVRGFL